MDNLVQACILAAAGLDADQGCVAGGQASLARMAALGAALLYTELCGGCCAACLQSRTVLPAPRPPPSFLPASPPVLIASPHRRCLPTSTVLPAPPQAYFIHDDNSGHTSRVNQFEFLRPLVEGLGYRYPTRSVRASSMCPACGLVTCLRVMEALAQAAPSHGVALPCRFVVSCNRHRHRQPPHHHMQVPAWLMYYVAWLLEILYWLVFPLVDMSRFFLLTRAEVLKVGAGLRRVLGALTCSRGMMGPRRTPTRLAYTHPFHRADAHTGSPVPRRGRSLGTILDATPSGR